MASINIKVSADVEKWLGALRVPGDIMPVPSLDKEWVTNDEIVLNKAAKYFEESNPGKQCIGYRSKMNDSGNGFVYMPVLIDKQ